MKYSIQQLNDLFPGSKWTKGSYTTKFFYLANSNFEIHYADLNDTGFCFYFYTRDGINKEKQTLKTAQIFFKQQTRFLNFK